MHQSKLKREAIIVLFWWTIMAVKWTQRNSWQESLEVGHCHDAKIKN